MNDGPDDIPLLCHRCGVELTPGEGKLYVVRIEALADPYPPVICSEDIEDDLDAALARIADQTRNMSEQELMDQVHRRMTIHLCNSCYVKWIENPAG